MRQLQQASCYIRFEMLMGTHKLLLLIVTVAAADADGHLIDSHYDAKGAADYDENEHQD